MGGEKKLKFNLYVPKLLIEIYSPIGQTKRKQTIKILEKNTGGCL